MTRSLCLLLKIYLKTKMQDQILRFIGLEVGILWIKILLLTHFLGFMKHDEADFVT